MFFWSEGTQAVLASCGDAIICAFRGTEDLADVRADVDARLIKLRIEDATAKGTWPGLGWMPDVSAPNASPGDINRGVKVHRGFHLALDEVWDDLYRKVRQLQENGNRPLWVTGHSLGGALACLAADRFQRAGCRVAGLYTFGQPRTGNGAFARHFNKSLRRRTFRFVNEDDPVTMVPTPLRFRHVGRLMFLDPEKGLQRDPGMTYVFGRVRRLVRAIKPVLGLRGLPRDPDKLKRVLAHHGIAEYVTKVRRLYKASTS